MKQVMTQELLNAMAQYEIDRLRHEVYGTRYLLEPDGNVVLLYPNGNKGPLPVYEDEVEL